MSLYNKNIINKILQITQQDCLEQRKFMVIFECKFVFFLNQTLVQSQRSQLLLSVWPQVVK